MNQKLLQILGSLRSSFSSEAVTTVQDDALRAHLLKAEKLASYLLVELIEIPAIQRATLVGYAQIVAEVEQLLVSAAGSVESLRCLERISIGADIQSFDQALAAAKQIQLQLHGIDSPAAKALIKRLVAIEGNYGARCNAAVLNDLAGTDKKRKPSSEAGLSKSFDQDKLQQFIIATFPEEKGVRIAECHFISGGASKYTVGITLSGAKNLPQAIVLRGDADASAQYGGADTGYEYRLLKIAFDRGVCVARPLAHEPSGAVFGSPFMLSERKPGRMIGHMFEMPAADKVTSADIAANLARIHLVPPDALGDWMRGAKSSNSAQTLAMLEESFNNWVAVDQPSPVFETAFKYLKDHAGLMDGTRSLVHGDYGLNNILIDERKVSVVLDWEFAQIGNPAYDLGYFRYQAEALSSWDEFLDAYERAGARLPSQAERDYATLFAATRLGVMVCQSNAAYHAGLIPGLAMAVNVSRRYHDVSLIRISKLLEQML